MTVYFQSLIATLRLLALLLLFGTAATGLAQANVGWGCCITIEHSMDCPDQPTGTCQTGCVCQITAPQPIFARSTLPCGASTEPDMATLIRPGITRAPLLPPPRASDATDL